VNNDNIFFFFFFFFWIEYVGLSFMFFFGGGDFCFVFCLRLGRYIYFLILCSVVLLVSLAGSPAIIFRKKICFEDKTLQTRTDTPVYQSK